MERFFFISTYDSITSEILASLLNAHPDIQCQINKNKGYLPTTIDLSLDEYMEKTKSADKEFSGCVGSGATSYELYNRSIAERSKHPFRKVNIILSPISRVRLLMYSWIKSGMPIDELANKLYQEFDEKSEKNEILDRYQVKRIYFHFLSAISKKIHEFQALGKDDPNYAATLQKMLTIGTPYGHIFLLAFAMTYAFDFADIPVSNKNFSFEKIISDENEYVKFLNYLTHNKITWSEENKSTYYEKLKEIDEIISNVFKLPWEEWQELLVTKFINIKLDFFYGSHVSKPLINMYENGGYNFAQQKPKQYSKLISIQLNSCRPVQLYNYFDNIEETADKPQDIEILVNIDRGDIAMKRLLEREIKERRFTIKYIESPRPSSYFDLWKPLNELIKITDPNAYFLLNVSDEMLFATKGWDTVLKKYVGYFSDDIFRLRLSRNKNRNYFDRWECNFAQDSCPITTKKWLDIGGDWNPCFGPDSFQQLVSFYLAKEGQYGNANYLRDIPIHDIKLMGDIPEIGIDNEKRWKHIKNSIKALLKCQSYQIQLEAKRRAILLKANIYVADKYITAAVIKDNKKKKCVEIIIEDKVLVSMSYYLSWWNITLTNQWRKLYLGYYFCEIVPSTSSIIKNVFAYWRTQWHWYYKIYHFVIDTLSKIKAWTSNALTNAVKFLKSPFKLFKPRTISIKKT